MIARSREVAQTARVLGWTTDQVRAARQRDVRAALDLAHEAAVRRRYEAAAAARRRR